MVVVSQHAWALLCLEAGFRLKVTFFCDFCAFRRKKLSDLQMACSCYSWQEDRRVSKPRLLLVSNSELASHFWFGFLLCVKTLLCNFSSSRNNCLSWISRGEVVVSTSFWLHSNLSDNGSFSLAATLPAHFHNLLLLKLQKLGLFPSACNCVFHMVYVKKDTFKHSLTW